MENRGLKRKFYEIKKNDLSVELHKLTLDSAELNNDVLESSKEFEKLLKSIADKQDEYMTRGLLLEEQFRVTISVLDGKKYETGGQSSGDNDVLPPAYASDVRRFADDSKTSLLGHGVVLNEEFEEMQKMIGKYEIVLNEKMEELKRRARLIDRERNKLSAALHSFIRYVPDDSEEDED